MWFQIWHEELGKISPNHSKVWKFHFDGLFLSKVYKVWAKKYRGVTFHDTEQWCLIWINPDLVVSKMAWAIGWTFIRALKSLKNCTLMICFLSKAYNFSARKFQRNYVSRHWRVMQNLKENSLLAWKITWGIWWTLVRAVESLKICTLMGYFCRKYVMFELKKYRQVVSWNGTYGFKNGVKEFQ